MNHVTLIQADARRIPLADRSVQCVVTSPPYLGLRDYGTAKWEGGDGACSHKTGRDASATTSVTGGIPHIGSEGIYRDTCGKCGARRVDAQIGLESSIEAYVATMVQVFREVRRVLRDDGVVFMNLGDSYVSGDMNPSRSRDASHGLSCDTNGTALPDSLSVGRACPCCGGELQDGSKIRRDYIARTCRQSEPRQRLDEMIGHDNGPLVSTAATSSPPVVRASTNLSSSSHARGASVPEARGVVSRSEAPTFDDCAPEFSRKQGSTSGTVLNDHPSGFRTMDTGSFCMACGYCTTTHPGLKPKNLLGMPWRIAFALQADGWILRSDCIWSKPNPMPESVTDRPTKSHEYIFLLSKRERYYYDAEAVREPHARIWDASTNGGSMATDRHHNAHIGGSNRHERAYPEPNPDGRNLRSVWTITPRPFPGAHFATFPAELAARCVAAGTSERGQCPRCGMAWRRVVEPDERTKAALERARDGQDWYARAWDNSDKRPEGMKSGKSQASGFKSNYLTLGWQPGCTCPPHEPQPQVVFDPFGGAGTVPLVASNLGRRGIMTELNPKYIRMARRRISRPHAKPERVERHEDLPLFSGLEI